MGDRKVIRLRKEISQEQSANDFGRPTGTLCKSPKLLLLVVVVVVVVVVAAAAALTDRVVIVERIKEGRTPFYRPPLPQRESEGVHPGVLTLMKHCWAEEPTERPSFNEVDKILKNINKGKLALFFCCFFLCSCNVLAVRLCWCPVLTLGWLFKTVIIIIIIFIYFFLPSVVKIPRVKNKS